MPDALFERAVALVLAHEGGDADNPADRGGETRFGICRAQYPDLDIAKLTTEQAKAIYRRDYWLKYGLDRLPAAVAPKILDTAVLCGPGTAIRLLQRSLGIAGAACAVDGAIGPATLRACDAVPAEALLATYRSLLERHFCAIAAADPSQQIFLRGWTARALAS